MDDMENAEVGGVQLLGDLFATVPKRDSFVVPTVFPEGEELQFMPNDIEEINTYSGGGAIYCIRIFGAFIDGSKVELNITDADVFFDIMQPDVVNFEHIIRALLADLNVRKIETVMAYPIKGYHPEPIPYLRVYFYNLADRTAAIKLVAPLYTTASDDKSNYFRKVARERLLPLCNWLTISDYKYTRGPTPRSPSCAHILIASINDIQASELSAPDKLTVLTWDIETYSPTGNLPVAQNASDCVFMICLTYHWVNSGEPLCKICISAVDMPPDKRWITIIAPDIIDAFAICVHNLAPDFIIGFNDSQYDWVFILSKTAHIGMLWDTMTCARHDVATWNGHTWQTKISVKPSENDHVTKWRYHRDKRIKITAEEVFYSSFLKFSGCVPIDVRVCFKKLYPKDETAKSSSLKAYLALSNLESKDDLPITKMWKFYKQALDGDPSNMHYVAHYCMVDALRCQQLMVCRSVINNYREVSNLAFLSVYDAHYYAGGVKVCNLLAAKAFQRNILTSMIVPEHTESGKYPGAFVFPPEKGISPSYANTIDDLREYDVARVLRVDRPVSGLDFASLYPSLIMTYNFSPEKIITDAATAAKWQHLPQHKIEFPFNGRTVEGWSVAHNNEDANIGLYPAVLIELMAKRAKVKKVLDAVTRAREQCEIGGATDTADYQKLCFEWTCLDTKQRAIKVYMNTFYGEAGNNLSPFFLLQLAGGVTSYGQYNIKMVAEFVIERGFKIKYGDTDSLYLVPPCEQFKDCDIQYISRAINKEEWCAQMVRATMAAMDQIRKEVNAHLQADNHAAYLKMAYEEVLYPVVFTGKKKYFGVAHLNEVNFTPKSLFIKGIDVVKQGQSGLAVEIGHRIMWACMALDNTRTLSKIVEDILTDAITNSSQWNFDHFIKSDAWKPDKNNIAVQRFITRMKARGEQLPDAGERFKYIIAKAGGPYDIFGKKINYKKGDLMEFVHVAQTMKLEVDVAYYIINYVVGLCARFINSDPAYFSEDDEQAQKNAKRGLEKFIADIQAGDDTKQVGLSYKRATKRLHATLLRKFGCELTTSLYASFDHEQFWAAAAAGVQIAPKYCEQLAAAHNIGEQLYWLLSIYAPAKRADAIYMRSVTMYCDRVVHAINARLEALDVDTLSATYEAEMMAFRRDESLHELRAFAPEDRRKLSEFRQLLADATYLRKFQRERTDYRDYLLKVQAQRIKLEWRPSPAEIAADMKNI